ncbi:TPA: hypothetical protein RQJ89_004203 [Vibrio vulnificus]|uniref:hypothetical protein n=1 Tax=Vibrio vulnificus TaxID=672 RepID=UPI0009B676F3|nr:hypothetical protein [Vibrio vulnificus]ELA7884155.1 hypothetical protein [Vibrio parahaemolyticus]EKJ5338321.1 hypothetical protein [Vibrio vulnificus]OQK33426.1 hypothetical protein XM72_u0016 [Vibrio vulnificus]HDY7666962.1 hypothetical protein [Vibrio vulnificus]HDY7672369.1 hypothetical protein [Vibrio vulnificus]
MPNNYNYIYNQLVGDDKDNIAGIIAYSVYKRQKIEFIKENGDSDLDTFQNISRSPAQIEFYKNEAAEILQNFAVTFLEEDLEDREKFFEAEVKREVQAKTPNFWTGVYQSILGSYGFIVSLGILLFIVWSSKVGIVQVLEMIFNVTITPK